MSYREEKQFILIYLYLYINARARFVTMHACKQTESNDSISYMDHSNRRHL